ncbi:MAG: DUF2460 domain-containing protein [Cyanobacteria bacterium P01_G01_bin.19]
MSDVYVFGTYFSYNLNLDNNRTANPVQTKWRSQFTVPQGSTISGSVNDFFFINATTHICEISDLDYQLKSTEPIADDFRIKRVQGVRRVDRDFRIGINAQIQFEHAEPEAEILDDTNPNSDPFAAPALVPKPLIAPQYIDFFEQDRLELGYDFGAVGGPSFVTEVIEVANDDEQRNGQKLFPLHRYQLGDRTIAESEVNKLAEVSYLKNFHAQRRGRKQGFRYKDWNDYQANYQFLGIGNGNITQYQLRKAYIAGGAVTYRPILKPVPGTVFIFENGTAAPDVVEDSVNGWHINIENGVLTRAAPLPNGVELTVTFEFDVPVWFETDKIDFSLDYFNLQTNELMYRLGSVYVKERPLPTAIPWSIADSEEMSEELDLGIIYDSVESRIISNIELALSSGYLKTENKRDDARTKFNLGSRNYNRQELDKLLGYFWNARGKSKQFLFKNLNQDYAVRFDQDELSIKFEAAQSNDALYSLPGLKIQVQTDFGNQEAEESIDYTDLLGHFAYLEGSNGDLYNFHQPGQSRFYPTETVSAVSVDLTSAVGDSSVYLNKIDTTISDYRLTGVPIDVNNQAGMTVILDVVFVGGVSLNRIFENAAPGSIHFEFYYDPNHQTWQILNQAFPAVDINLGQPYSIALPLLR